MPSPRREAILAELRIAVANDDAATKAKAKTRAKVLRLAIRAVEAGAVRYQVAQIVGMSPQHLGRIPGMPPKIAKDLDA